MVELQESLPDLEGADVVPVVISYDPVAVLDDFATSHGITYRLLSDPGSVQITRLGLLNPHVRRQHEETNEPHEDRFEGVPYPASFLLDERGIVADRLLHDDYRVREAAGSILRGRFGFRSTSSGPVSYPGEIVTVTVTPDSTHVSPFQKVWLDFEVDVADGWHIYGPGAPTGVVGLRVDPDEATHQQPGTVVYETDPVYKEVAGVEGQVPTYQGRVLMRLPIVVSGSIRSDVVVRGSVAFQACTATTCLPPGRVEWSVTLSPRRV